MLCLNCPSILQVQEILDSRNSFKKELAVFLSSQNTTVLIPLLVLKAKYSLRKLAKVWTCWLVESVLLHDNAKDRNFCFSNIEKQRLNAVFRETIELATSEEPLSVFGDITWYTARQFLSFPAPVAVTLHSSGSPLSFKYSLHSFVIAFPPYQRRISLNKW